MWGGFRKKNGTENRHEKNIGVFNPLGYKQT